MDSGGGGGGGGGSAAPTGCYKCGRPGHWSRDCPSNPNNNEDLHSIPSGPANYSQKTYNSVKNNARESGSAPEKPKRLRRTRPKLTPDLLLSNDGIGYILRHFPRAFKYRGRGREVNDLGNLLGMYAEWHSRLLPYYSFDQFVHKVEQIGGKNRVKKCIRDLGERVANGVDPAKLHDPENQEDMSNHDHVTETEDLELEVQNIHQDDTWVQNPDTDNHPERNLNEISENIMKEPWKPANHQAAPADVSSVGDELPNKDNTGAFASSNRATISEEQRARMQANRLKALEKAAARAQKLQ